MTTRSVALVAIGLLGLFAVPASADVLLLKDGRYVDGREMERKDGFIEIQYENGVVKVREGLVDTFVSDDLAFVPETPEEKEKFAEGLYPWEGKWLKESQWRRKVEQSLADRRAEVEEAIAHSEWGNRYEEDSKNFEWHYTVPKAVGEYFQVRCEAYYEMICKDWKVGRNKKKDKMSMNLYGDRREFHRTSGAPGGALAYFMFLGSYDLNFFYDRLDRDLTEMVLYHELSHYMQKLIDMDFRMPHWPGEALAEYYGAMKYDPGTRKMETGLLQDGRLAEIKADMKAGTYLSIRDMITKDAYSDYTWGWSFVHFMMADDKRAKLFKKFFMGLANDKDVDRTRQGFNLKFVTGGEVLRYFMDTFKLDEDGVKELEKEWYAFIERLETESASGLDKAAAKALQYGYKIQAKRLLQEAMDAGSENPQTYYRFAKLVKGESRADAIKAYRSAIELDPLVATYYWELGKLLEAKEKEEGERLQALAVELDPHIETTWYDIDF